MKIFSRNSKSSDSEESEDSENSERPAKRANLTNNSDERPTTQIIMAASSSPLPLNHLIDEIKPKRKRRLKPKEESEESPYKRLMKLTKENIAHTFVVDPRNPLKRLKCLLCKDSVLCYRWSTVTDHLDTKKHNHLKERAFTKMLIEDTEHLVVHENVFDKHIEYNQTSNNMTYSLIPSNPYIIPLEDNNNNKTSDIYSNPIPSTSTQLPYPTLNLDDLNNNGFQIMDLAYLGAMVPTPHSFQTSGNSYFMKKNES